VYNIIIIKELNNNIKKLRKEKSASEIGG